MNNQKPAAHATAQPLAHIAIARWALHALHFLVLTVLLLAGLSQAHAQTCGQEGGQPCPVWVHVPSCDKYLVESGGKCIHPACGKNGQSACTVNVRIPSCDANLVEANGRCASCGPEGQRACPVTVRVPSCDANLVESSGMCIHPACGRNGQRACVVTERIPSCDGSLTETNGRCGACGAEGQAACAVTVRVPSCDPYLVESNGMCAHPACGREGQNACTVGVRIPSCDPNLVESGGKCIQPTPCGAENQRACLVTERLKNCDANLIESGGRCMHPPCGKEGQNACVVTVRIPSCDGNLVEVNGRCDLPTPCGAETQRACPVWKRIPSCDANLVETGGICVHPPCGKEGQNACAVTVRLPSCDAGLAESNGKCIKPTACGAEGQPACPVNVRIPSCYPYLIESGGMCTHPPCGRDGQNACAITVRIPSCDTNMVEVNGRCAQPAACGAEGQAACTVNIRIPSCDPYLIEAHGRCIHPPCGQIGKNACKASVRIPSCDANLVESNRICVHPACGKENQRACLITERIPSCDSYLVEASGTCVHPPCGKEGQAACYPNVRLQRCDANLVARKDICEAITPCGATGLRACTAQDQGTQHQFPCDAGLVEVAGCIGTCLGAGGSISAATCMNQNLALSEPSTNAQPLPPNPRDPLRGFADLHVHMFSHLAFGGGVMAGTPYSATGGAAAALRPDYATDLNLVSIANTPMPVHVCPPLIPNCGRTILHGDHIPGFDDSAGAGTGDGTTSNFGAPLFNGWPTWHGTTHQQVYYKWLERAWQSGMRVMVMFGVSNEVLCQTSKRVAGTNCANSMKSIDDQLAAAVEFQQWSAQQPGGGWFQIVRTPEEAERVIRSGKLAVILGIEADNLFNCKLGSNCTFDHVSAQIDKYYKLGVRHIFPIHDFDNAFGGTAVWMDALGLGNRFMEGQWYDAVKCDADISDFKLAGSVLPSIVSETIGKIFDWNHVPYPVYPDTPHCNRKGLTPLGKQLVAKMMDLGMIIDVDHMSLRSLMDTAAMAQERGIGYPLVVGHVTISELYQTSPTANRHERRRTKEQLDIMKRLGGMAGIITTADDKLAALTIPRPGGARAVNGVQQRSTTDDCINSSKSLAQTYLFISKEAKIPVGFGSDFNGMAPHYGPRFGDDACNKRHIDGQWQAQVANKRWALDNPNRAGHDRPLGYPFVVPGFGTFNKQITGQRTFDFNTDGLAHIGLYPDLIADLLNVGVATDELEPLMHSAAAYVTLWKRARALASPSVVNGMEKDTDRLGQDYKGLNLTQADPALCQTACQGEAQCLAWTYVKPGVQGPVARCYLKNAVPAPTPNTCCVSGMK